MTKIMGLKPILYAWKHAYLAYSEPKDNESHDLLNESNFISFQNETDYAYAAFYGDHIVFSFRGTDNVKGWISDFDLFPLKKEEYLRKNLNDGKWGKGSIHDGFYSSWQFFKSCVDSVVKEFNLKERKDVKIFTTGHSRGGPLSELCARHLAKKYKLSVSCFTYGCPAVGIGDYRDYFRSLPINGTRVLNGWDIVYFVPPKFLGFKHGCANLVWNKKSWWKRLIPRLRIKDHLTSNYDKFITKRFID